MKPPSIPMRIAAAVVVLALGLVGLVVREGMARAGGQEVRLAITGYDPRSLLTGHYVQFRLVDTVPAEQACRRAGKRMEPRPGGWFAVAPDGAAHRIVASATTRAAALRLGEVAVRGEAECYGVIWSPGPGREVTSPTFVSLDIGVDRIHLDQEEAQALEKALRGEGAIAASWAVVSVGRDGKARLKGLIVGDRRADLSWF
jgi:uncharacterized membrane-anchored protein